ncbi:MAG: hypothetical protein QXG91_01660 [Candidatus Aenigmatarchaeota archaeon]
MSRKRPKEEKVMEIIKRIVSSRLMVDSLEKLYFFVLEELKKEDKEYSISPQRIKKIVMKMDEINIKVKTRESASIRKINECPVCKSSLEEIKTKNLANKDVVIGYKCSKCGYISDLKSFAPMRYVFLKKIN